MTYLQLNYEAIASDLVSRINDEEVQNITLSEDHVIIQVVVDKTLVRSMGSNAWECKVVSAHVYTNDGELIFCQYFEFDELNQMIGLVDSVRKTLEVVTCTQCGSTSVTREHRSGVMQIFSCKGCDNVFAVEI